MFVTMILALFTSPAHADTPEEQPKKVSVTLSPLHLLLPIVEVTTEVRVRDDLGMAAILGYGSYNTYSTFELGAQGRFYPIGDFEHGMQLGIETMITSVSTTESGVRASGTGFGGGPFIGYKVTARYGLTFEAQLGAQYLTVAAVATDGQQTARVASNGFGPLLNLNLGWSF